MLAVIIFIIILGVLVFVHEMGHFVVAKRNGIRADEFGFGFPPRIVGIQYLYEKGKKRKKRIIWGNKDGDDENEKKDLAKAHEKKITGGTIYSLNWIPLGGFVKIKGEDGERKRDADSFASKPAWPRIKVLAAGVFMNFVLAWFLISLAFFIGSPQIIDSGSQNGAQSKIQISGLADNSPAKEVGLKIGDEILKRQKDFSGQAVEITNIESLQEYVNENAGKEIVLDIKRGQENIEVLVTPRENAPEGEGPLGVALSETTIIKYSFFRAIWEGFKTTLNLIGLMLAALVGIIKNLFLGQGPGVAVAGPVGIAVLTKEVADLGFVYILQFTAFLSINLGIINILPIPALDGGRILFVLIEKIKGSPVSQKVEQTFHSIFFLLLILLLILITFSDVLKFVK